MAFDLADLSADARDFLTERHLATLTTARPDGSPHVTPVGFSYDVEARIARVITWSASRKAIHAADMAEAGRRAVLCQVDGARWMSLEGTVRLVSDADGIAPGVRGYAARYREPKDRDDRVVIEIDVDRIIGSGRLR
ncbi:MAG: pyridoxamine 5'-phosphate oxidase family protein [Actinomycetota bacterium]